jgi:hypothetical protein
MGIETKSAHLLDELDFRRIGGRVEPNRNSRSSLADSRIAWYSEDSPSRRTVAPGP